MRSVFFALVALLAEISWWALLGADKNVNSENKLTVSLASCFCLDQTIVKVIFDALLRLPTASFSSKHYATARIKATFIETKLHKMSFGFRVYRPTASTSESKHRVKYTALLSSLVVLPGHPFENFFFYA